MADIKKIFKDEILSIGGSTSSQDEVTGCYGEVALVVRVNDSVDKPNVLLSDKMSGDFNLSFTKDVVLDFSTITPDFGDVVTEREMTANSIYNYDFNLSLTYVLNKPAERVNISASLFYEIHTLETDSPFAGEADKVGQIAIVGERIANFIREIDGNPHLVQVGDLLMGGDLLPDIWGYTALTGEDVETFEISDVEFSGFNVSFTATLNKIKTVKSFYYLNNSRVHNGEWVDCVFKIKTDVYIPKYIEITIKGDSYEATPQQFYIGDQSNAIEIPSSTLVTTNATIDGVPLYQYRANRMLNERNSQKQSITLTKVINNNDMLHDVEDDVSVINARSDNMIDENAQSFQRNADGTAKKYKVKSAEFVFDGSYKQILNIREDD